MSNARCLTFVTGSLAAAAMATSAHAVVLVSDDFSDGNRTENPPWYLVGIQNNINLSVVDDSAGIGSGPAMLMDFSDSFSGSTAAYLGFTPTTLSNPGDYIRVEFDVRYVDVAGTGEAVSAAMRMGLFDTAGTPTLRDGSEPYLRDRTPSENPGDGYGYGVVVDANGAVGATVEYYRFRPNLSIFNTAFNDDNVASIPSSDTDFYLTTGVQRVAYQILLTGDPGDDSHDLQFSWTLDDLTDTRLLSNKFDSPNTLTFGNFMIGGRSTASGNDLIIDNVMITTNVPEPAAACALAGAGLLALGRRRRG